MPFTKPQLIIFGFIVLVIIILGLMFSCTIPGIRSCAETTEKITTTISLWEVDGKDSNFTGVKNYFKVYYPGVQITYRSFETWEEYERMLLDALATGTGPDIFAISNRSLPRQITKINPLPKEKFSILDLRNLFPQVVEQDFSSGGVVYALPASIDTLSLVYNRDLLDQALVEVPKNWEEFKVAVSNLSIIKDGKKIERAGASMGGTVKTIANAPDILSLLMLQTGTEMISSNFKSARFGSSEGADALRFYTSFANASDDAYTWNDTMPSAIDAFSSESSAMIFEYHSGIKNITERNAFLNIGIAPVPQPKNAQKEISYAKYSGYAVSKQSKYPDVAWDFILYLTAIEKNTKQYAEVSGKISAFKSLLINTYSSDPELGTFAKQALTARSWPQIDETLISGIFSNMIDVVISNQKDIQDAIQSAQDEVTRLISKTVL